MKDRVKEIQENQYALPYHWFMDPDDYRGRKYFGYTGLCIKLVKSQGVDLTRCRMLDAGCGDGRFIKMLFEAGAAEVGGLDYSERAVSFARILLPQSKFFVADLTSSGTLSQCGTFDCIFLIETLEHIEIEKVPQVLSNLRSMLKNGGYLVVTVPSTNIPLQDKHYQHFTKEKLEQYLSKDFKVLHILGHTATKKHVFKFLYRLIHNRFWEIIPLRKWYNKEIYPKYCLESKPENGEGLIAIVKNEE